MAGDTGSPPQCQPTDLSMKSRRRNSPDESDKIKAYNYERLEPFSNGAKWMSAPYRISGQLLSRNATNANHAPATRTPEENRKEAIRNAITVITRSLTPTSSGRVRLGGVVQTPSNEDVVFVYAKGATTPQTSTGKMTVVRSLTTSTTRSPEMEIYEEREPPPRYPFVTPTESHFPKEVPQWRFPTAERPKYLDLRQVPERQETSPDSGLESATPVFNIATPQALAESVASPETPDCQAKYGQRRRKRKLGPGRGWKFHDLSNDGGTNKKRAYAHNKLENEILQRFQDRVCVKSVPTPDGNKDKLIIVEPSEVTDSDLIRCGTSLRLVFDKEVGSYKLQLLPYTLEEGPLSDQNKVLQAVSKMLAENKEVLCPSVFTSLLQTGNSVVIGERADDGSCVLLNSPTETQYVTSAYGGERQVTKGRSSVKSKRNLSSPAPDRRPLAKQRDMLLWSLNNELARNNNALAGASAAGRKKCLMWHVPSPDFWERFPPSSKWCVNCKAPGGVRQSPQKEVQFHECT